MSAMTLHTLNASLKSAEAKHALHMAKGFNPDLAPSTRRKYQKEIPALQRRVLELRKQRNEFIDQQRAARGLKPRVYGEVLVRRH